MRLAVPEQVAIHDAIHQADVDAEVYLFGSRTDDTARGGDIDLLVLSKRIGLMKKLEILAQLHEKLGERKIDIAIFPDTKRPFAKIALEKGIRL
jgi:predicted nucleotidyltransferase